MVLALSDVQGYVLVGVDAKCNDVITLRCTSWQEQLLTTSDHILETSCGRMPEI